MNRQRKVVITVTYNELGTIVDTKAEELDLSAQQNLQPTCNQLATDCISRQAAIDALDVLCQEHRYRIPGKRETYSQYNEAWQDALGRAEGVICNLPSTQPEVIRCTECKHYREYDSEYVENAVVVQCMADRYPISETIPDGWFCAGAERKDDE